MKYCEKEFLTDSPEPSTSTVVSFYGDVQWGRNDRPENLSFLEISDCHERVRLHRPYEMTNAEWLAQVQRLQAHIGRYINFLETVYEAEKEKWEGLALWKEREE
jgi:hypothetical protein